MKKKSRQQYYNNFPNIQLSINGIEVIFLIISKNIIFLNVVDFNFHVWRFNQNVILCTVSFILREWFQFDVTPENHDQEKESVFPYILIIFSIKNKEFYTCDSRYIYVLPFKLKNAEHVTAENGHRIFSNVKLSVFCKNRIRHSKFKSK